MPTVVIVKLYMCLPLPSSSTHSYKKASASIHPPMWAAKNDQKIITRNSAYIPTTHSDRTEPISASSLVQPSLYTCMCGIQPASSLWASLVSGGERGLLLCPLYTLIRAGCYVCSVHCTNAQCIVRLFTCQFYNGHLKSFLLIVMTTVQSCL